jgi:hypothetical protein
MVEESQNHGEVIDLERGVRIDVPEKASFPWNPESPAMRRIQLVQFLSLHAMLARAFEQIEKEMRDIRGTLQAPHSQCFLARLEIIQGRVKDKQKVGRGSKS